MTLRSTLICPTVPTCGCALRIGRCARPTLCSASSPGCSSSRTPASRPRRSWIWPTASRSAAAFGSTTTMSPARAAGGRLRPRFGLAEDDVAGGEGWGAAAGIRWGLDAPHRQPFRLERFAAGTWQAGLDRVLVGVTTTEADRRLGGGALPLDDVGSSDIDLAGRLTELVHRLTHA